MKITLVTLRVQISGHTPQSQYRSTQSGIDDMAPGIRSTKIKGINTHVLFQKHVFNKMAMISNINDSNHFMRPSVVHIVHN